VLLISREEDDHAQRKIVYRTSRIVGRYNVVSFLLQTSALKRSPREAEGWTLLSARSSPLISGPQALSPFTPQRNAVMAKASVSSGMLESGMKNRRDRACRREEAPV
jgi:hypothetical protein